MTPWCRDPEQERQARRALRQIESVGWLLLALISVALYVTWGG
jgi:hypothetical protein